jgi:hypothetical protein
MVALRKLTFRRRAGSDLRPARAGSALLALLAVVGLGVPAAVSAAPTVTLKAKIVPIPKSLSKRGGPTWPKTGNILGAPAALEGTITIKGSEYPTASEGFSAGTELNVGPPPLRRVEVYFPKGTKISSAGFKACPLSKFEDQMEPPCPKGSEASPPGEADGKVFFGKTVVEEKVSVTAYFAPGTNKLAFWIEGREPAVIEKYATGSFTTISGPFTKKLTSNVPLVETVSGAPYAMAEQIRVTLGAAMMKGKKLISAGYVPKTCPKSGHFDGKAELWFGGGGESSWEKATASTTVPCPKGA